MEPASGFSTYCRKCGGHFKLGGPPAAARKGLGALMDRARGRHTAPVPALSSPPPRPPSLPFQISGYGDHDAPLVARAASLSKSPVSSTHREPPREVECFDCGAKQKVAAASTSTICRGCSTYLDLRSIEIKDRTNQRIRTRGDVTVEKKGALLGASVHCGHLTIYGTVSGSIYASGDVHLKNDSRILGEVRCRRFILDKKCEVQCLQPVHAEVVEIHGHATGHFHATRCITLSRHAELTGSATAQTIAVEPGGILNGQILVQHPAPPGPLLLPALAAGY